MPPESAPPDPSTRPGTPEARAWILVRYIGQPLGEVIPLPLEGLDIGRAAECGLCLPEPEVSRRHARLEAAPGGATISLHDLGSTNGLYVNGRRVEAEPGPVALRAGDVLRVGAHAFKLKRLDLLDRQYQQDSGANAALDGLTGVGGRATVLAQLEAHFELARRHQRPLAVILADLDGLEQINVGHGPEAGDRVIRAFGGHLARRLRGSDPVGRLGGEEFLAILPETTAALALNAAEDLRAALAGCPVDAGEGRFVHATCSLGVAELKPSDTGGGALLARADAALHRAKAEGRNRVAQAP